MWSINPLNAELNPICHLLALLRTHHILHVSRIRVKACDVCVTVHRWYNNINSQLDATITNFIDNYNQFNMFRAIISPIIRSTRLCKLWYNAPGSDVCYIAICVMLTIVWGHSQPYWDSSNVWGLLVVAMCAHRMLVNHRVTNWSVFHISRPTWMDTCPLSTPEVLKYVFFLWRLVF